MSGARTGNSLYGWRRTISTIRSAGSVAAWRTVAIGLRTVRAIRRAIRPTTHAVTNRGTQFLLRQLSVAIFVERLERPARVCDLIRVNHAVVVRVERSHQRGWWLALTIHAGTALTSGTSIGTSLTWWRTLTIRRRTSSFRLSHEH